MLLHCRVFYFPETDIYTKHLILNEYSGRVSCFIGWKNWSFCVLLVLFLFLVNFANKICQKAVKDTRKVNFISFCRLLAIFVENKIYFGILKVA